MLRASGLAATTLAATISGCSSTDNVDDQDDNLGFAGVVLGYPMEKPAALFTDTDGAPYDVREETSDQLALFLFGYTSCPDVCPVHLNILSKALEKISGPASKAKVIMVGCDTARDTPEVLRTYLDKRNKDFVGLTASAETIDQVLANWNLPPIVIEPAEADGSYAVGHPSQIIAFTPDNLCHILYPFGVRQQEWEKDLPRLQTYDWPVTTR